MWRSCPATPDYIITTILPSVNVILASTYHLCNKYCPAGSSIPVDAPGRRLKSLHPENPAVRILGRTCTSGFCLRCGRTRTVKPGPQGNPDLLADRGVIRIAT